MEKIVKFEMYADTRAYAVLRHDDRTTKKNTMSLAAAPPFFPDICSRQTSSGSTSVVG